MKGRPDTRAEQIRAALGTGAREYRVRVTGTKKRTGATVFLRTFVWTPMGWTIDTSHLHSRLDSDDPGAADQVISATLSRRHGRLGENRDTVHFGRGVDVPYGVLSVILDAARDAQLHMLPLDGVKVVVSQLGSRIAKLFQLDRQAQQHARPALYTEILARCAKFG